MWLSDKANLQDVCCVCTDYLASFQSSGPGKSWFEMRLLECMLGEGLRFLSANSHSINKILVSHFLLI